MEDLLLWIQSAECTNLSHKSECKVLKLRAVLIFLFMLLVSCETIAAASCFELFYDRNKILFHESENTYDSSNPLVHIYRGGEFRISNEKWIRWFSSVAQNRESLQKEWPSLSLYGQVWAAPTSHPFTSNGQQPSILFNLKPDYVFFDPQNPSHQKAWKTWEEKHLLIQNNFSREQTSSLKEGDFPYHSAFYEQFRLAGVRRQLPWPKEHIKNPNEGSYWSIVNFHAVKSVTLSVPGQGEVPPATTLFNYP